jgi:hypothetical protein
VTLGFTVINENRSSKSTQQWPHSFKYFSVVRQRVSNVFLFCATKTEICSEKESMKEVVQCKIRGPEQRSSIPNREEPFEELSIFSESKMDE